MKKIVAITLLAFAYEICFAQNANEQIELIPKRLFKK
jgi:hypothetical protein